MVTERTLEVRAKGTRLRKYACDMRHEQTVAEQKIWQQIRDRRLDHHKFKRQYPIGPYIVDFICLEQRLIVELDGGQHASQQSYDAARDAFLMAQGFQVLRLWNHDVLTNMEGVVVTLLDALRGGETPSPRPSPPKGARE